MEKDELLSVWVDVLHEGNTYTDAQEAKVLEVLNAVYNVGFEAGKDAQKLEQQLNRKPTKEPISNTEPGAI